VSCLVTFVGMRQLKIFSLVIGTALLVSSCSTITKLTNFSAITDYLSSDDETFEKTERVMNFGKPAKKPKSLMADAPKTDKMADDEENESDEDKEADKKFAAMKKEQEAADNKAKTDANARAAERATANAVANSDNAGQPAGVSKDAFETEMLAINLRLHSLSERVENISDQVHDLAERQENMPTSMAKSDMADKTPKHMTGMKSEPEMADKKPEMKPEPKMADKKPDAMKPKPAKAPQPLLQPFGSQPWGVQLGAYKTRSGAEASWGKTLANTTVLELNDAVVRYVPSKPRKNGQILTLVVINEYANRTAAKAACKSLKGKGVDCIAVNTER
jgi:cell division protein FtsN